MLEINLEEVAKNLVEDIIDMRRQKDLCDLNDSLVDYLEGCIETREVVIGKLGFAHLLPTLCKDCEKFLIAEEVRMDTHRCPAQQEYCLECCGCDNH